MCRLSEDDLEIAEDGEVWIKTSRKKTKIDYELPLLDIPLRILDKYRGIAPEGKLLPMYGNTTLNRALKRIASICGIEGAAGCSVSSVNSSSNIRIPVFCSTNLIAGCSSMTTQSIFPRGNRYGYHACCQ